MSKTCLVQFDKNKYSVMAQAVGRPVEVHAYAERIAVRQDGMVVGDHARCFGRNQTIYDPWHYVPVLARKPGAMRNGAPFKDWAPPGALGRVQQKLKATVDGDRQMVAILTAVLADGRPRWRPPARRRSAPGCAAATWRSTPCRCGTSRPRRPRSPCRTP